MAVKVPIKNLVTAYNATDNTATATINLSYDEIPDKPKKKSNSKGKATLPKKAKADESQVQTGPFKNFAWPFPNNGGCEACANYVLDSDINDPCSGNGIGKINNYCAYIKWYNEQLEQANPLNWLEDKEISGCDACFDHYKTTTHSNPCNGDGVGEGINEECVYTNEDYVCWSCPGAASTSSTSVKKSKYAKPKSKSLTLKDIRAVHKMLTFRFPPAREPEIAEEVFGTKAGLDLKLNLAQSCADFFILERLYNELYPWDVRYPRGMFPVRFGSDSRTEFRAYTVKSYLENLEANLARQFAKYLSLACGGELRHFSYKATNEKLLTPRVLKYLTKLHGVPRELRVIGWRTWNQLSKRNPGVWLEDAAKVFNNGAWVGGYGGPKWGTAAGITAAYYNRQLSPRAYVNLCFSLEHNGGCIFNKFYRTPDLTVKHGNSLSDVYPHMKNRDDLLRCIKWVLEVQAVNAYDELAEWCSINVYMLWREHMLEQELAPIMEEH